MSRRELSPPRPVRKVFRGPEVRRFLLACENGREAEVKRGLADGHDPNGHDDLVGERPLHYACRNGHLGVARILLAAGAGIELRVGYGGKVRPLETAAEHGHLSLVKFLVARNAQLNPDGNPSALVAAAKSGHLSIVRLLVDKGSLLTKETLYWGVRSGNVPVVKFLLDAGLNIGSRNDAFKLLSSASRLSAGPDMLQLLEKHGADLSLRSEDKGESLLHITTSEPTALYLIGQGADVSARDVFGNTPMHNCASRGFVKACRFLLERGADPRAATKRRFSVRQVAQMGGQTPVVELITNAMRKTGRVGRPPARIPSPLK